MLSSLWLVIFLKEVRETLLSIWWRIRIEQQQRGNLPSKNARGFPCSKPIYHNYLTCNKVIICKSSRYCGTQHFLKIGWLFLWDQTWQFFIRLNILYFLKRYLWFPSSLRRMRNSLIIVTARGMWSSVPNCKSIQIFSLTIFSLGWEWY